MVIRAASTKIRPGFTIVELMVALVVFSLGVLGAAATLVHAARALHTAAAHEAAVALAANTLDSLALEPEPAAGELSGGPWAMSWSIDDEARPTAIKLAVEYTAGAADRRIEFHMLHLPPLVQLPHKDPPDGGESTGGAP